MDIDYDFMLTGETAEDEAYNHGYAAGYDDGWRDSEIADKDAADGHWIEVDDALPHKGQAVWVCDGEHVSMAYRSDDGINDTWVPIIFWDGKTHLSGPVKFWRELQRPMKPEVSE